MKRLLLIGIILVIGTSKLLSQVQIGQDLNGSFENNRYGQEIALSDDGKVIAILSTNINGNKRIEVFKESDGIWSPYGEFEENQYYEGSFKSIVISGDGNTLAYFDIGYLVVLTFKNGIWTPKGNPLDESDQYGSYTRLSLSYDGNVMGFGKATYSTPDSNSKVRASGLVPPLPVGRVGIYHYGDEGWIKTWEQVNDGGSQELLLGYDIDLAPDGTKALITSHIRTVILKYDSGSWQILSEKIDDGVSGKEAEFSDNGSIVSITELLGVDGVIENETRVYQVESGIWTQLGNSIIHESFSVIHGGYLSPYGSIMSMNLSSDGYTLVLTSPSPIDLSHSNKTIIYQYIGNEWNKQGEIIVSEAIEESANMAIALTPDAKRLAVSNPQDNEIGENAGKVRVFELDNVLSVNEFQNSEIKLFPNPTSNNIELVLPSGIELQQINILSILGQKVLTAKTTHIDVSFLSQGTYYAEIITNKGSSYKKLIVN